MTTPNEKTCNDIIAERGETYGDATINARCASRLLTSLVETHFQMKLPHEIPPQIAFLFMTMTKCLRASNAHASPHDDSYVDAINYLKLSHTAHAETLDEQK